MENSAVLRLVFLLVGFLAFSHCEEERIIRIEIGNSPVYRNAFYVNGNNAALICIPPDESNQKHDELAIYSGNGTHDKLICKVSGVNAPQKCSTDTPKSFSTVITQTGRYVCKYDKAPEPPVKEAEVTVYFSNQSIEVSNENGQKMSSSNLRVTNETSYRFSCPGADQPDVTAVHWYRNEHELKFDHGNPHYEMNDTTRALIFKKTKNPDASKFGGWYRCEVIKSGSKTSSFLKVDSYAYANVASKSYNKMEGESATLSCEVEGEPVPTVQWTRGGKPIDSNPDDRKRITFSSYKGIPHASVTISNLVAEDYGEYTCVADGTDGTDGTGGSHAEAVTLLRVRSKLAALWPFLGIVAEVIVLVAIIFIYEKRRAKKEQEENEDAADQKKSLTASNNENKDVRQRKA